MLAQKDNRLYIVSLQSEEEYAAGHVPGAVRLALDLRDPAPALATLPEDRPIVVTCSNGQRSCQVALFLRQLGYDAGGLMLGMQGWNRAYAGSGAFGGGENLPITQDVLPLPQGDIAASAPSGLGDRDLILQRSAAYAAQGRPVIISPQEALAMMDSALLISMQAPDDYAANHIAGAASLPASVFMSGGEELLRLPRDRKIIVACYIGHYSNFGTLLLNQLGYEAYSLEWGLSGWNPAGMKNGISWLEKKTELPVEGKGL